MLNVAAGVHETEAVALELLHDEALAAEQANSEFALKRNPNRHPARGAEKRILLAHEMPAERAQIHRQDLSRIRRSECHLVLILTLVGEGGHEQAFPCQDALAGAEQGAHDAARLPLTAVAKDGLHLDALRHVHHRAGFGDRALTGIELHFDELHLAAVNLEVDVMRASAWRRWRCEALARPRLARRSARTAVHPGRECGNVPYLLPVRHAGAEDQRLRIDAAVLQIADDFLLTDGPDLVTADRHVPLIGAVHRLSF